MKRIFAIILAALMLAAALASCAAVAPDTAVGANITLTSSDACDAAAWLTERLGTVPDKLVLGTDASAYGVDLSTLEDDGYFIRTLGGEIALFARTPDGLDRAARKYAKTVESGAAAADVTYHEGARLKRLTVAGRDVSEYTIYCENEANMIGSANDLAAHIKTACGAKLAVSTDEPAAPYIALCYVHDEALGSVGYRWNVTDGGLTIECSDAYEPQSSLCAVRRFLETRLDWYGLIYGFEDLAEADLIEIASGESGEETAAFEWTNFYNGGCWYYDSFDNNIQGCGIGRNCCHGLQNNRFAAELSATGDWSADQPCWLDEEFYEVSLADIGAYIQARLDAGQVIGKDLFFVDVAAGDNSNWCTCKECTALLRKEGSLSAHVLTWVNRLSEELNETYPGVDFGVFAYAGTNKPPKTVTPAEHVYVTFCFDRNCSEHPLDGSMCTWGDPGEGRPYGPRDNGTYAGYIRRWTEICGNMYVWYYGLPNLLLSMSYMHTVRSDITFLYSLGVKGVFWEAELTGIDTNLVAHQIAGELVWNVGIGDEEYEALCDRAFAATYGYDSAPLVRDYVKILDRAHEASMCESCWAFGQGALTLPGRFYALSVDPGGIADHYDLMFGLVENALSAASCAKQEKRLVYLAATAIYKGSVAAYPEAQAEGDTQRMAELSRRYALMVERFAKIGVDITNGRSICGSLGNVDYPATIEELYPEGEHLERYLDPKPFD